MRVVGVKSAEKQGSSIAFKVRDLLVRQRTQAINALRGHLAEYGLIVAQGVRHIPRLAALLAPYPDLPDLARSLCQNLLTHVKSLSEQRAELEKGLRVRARQDEVASRLMTIPGIGAICASDRGLGAVGGDLFQGTRFCGLGWSHAQTDFLWR